MVQARYSLIDEPWIVCLMRDGSVQELSLLDAFRLSSEIREIVGEVTTQAFAILRVLLAITHRAVVGPKGEQEWLRLWMGSALPLDRIEAYLEQYRERFDLFGPTPFLQTPGLHTAKNEVFGLEKVIADVPAKYPYLTTRIGRGIERISFAEAARWLVHVVAFDPSGIRSGAVGDDRVTNGKVYPIGPGWSGYLGGLFVEGDTLRETLLLNLIPRDQPNLVESEPEDRPAWEAAVPGPEVSPDAHRRPYGPLDLFTWPSRRVLLHGDAEGVTGVVVTNGDRLTPQNSHHREPLTAWRRSVPQQKKLGLALVYMPQEHDPSRALWRGLASLLPAASPKGKGDGADHMTAAVVEWAGQALEGSHGITLRAIGMVYGSNNSVVDDIVDDRLAIRAALIGQGTPALQLMAVDAVTATERAVLALRNLASNLVKAAGGTDAKLADGARDRAAEQVYAALDAPFRRWLADLDADTDPERAQQEWHAVAKGIVARHGDRLVNAAGPTAWVGRVVGNRRISAPEADGWFRMALAEALPIIKQIEEVPS